MEDKNTDDNKKGENINKINNNINKENLEDVDEILLFGDENDNNEKSVGLSDSQSKEEALTLEEYYLECSRFGELADLKEAMKDAKENFNVNLTDFGGNTALHLASANGFIDVVKYLVNELHCDINAKNKSLSTPLSWAAFNGQKDVVEFLLEKGADFNFKNINGKKPSELAYDSGFYDVSDILLTKENEFYKGSIKEEKNEDEDLDLAMEEENKKEKENRINEEEKKEEEKKEEEKKKKKMNNE